MRTSIVSPKAVIGGAVTAPSKPSTQNHESSPTRPAGRRVHADASRPARGRPRCTARPGHGPRRRRRRCRRGRPRSAARSCRCTAAARTWRPGAASAPARSRTARPRAPARTRATRRTPPAPPARPPRNEVTSPHPPTARSSPEPHPPRSRRPSITDRPDRLHRAASERRGQATSTTMTSEPPHAEPLRSSVTFHAPSIERQREASTTLLVRDRARSAPW